MAFPASLPEWRRALKAGKAPVIVPSHPVARGPGIEPGLAGDPGPGQFVPDHHGDRPQAMAAVAELVLPCRLP